ncbi:hypothetical protein [Streptomyces sp. NPDC001250]|uniref:hypothetical protein n=1 Tax=Streptomyces sp. NPDC001250 TaxID=3154382 RepID=UPI00332E6326
MTTASTMPEGTTIAASPDSVAAVLYVCVERSKLTPSMAAQRAEDEGRSFAAARDLRIMDTIHDPYGEPDPLRREGWMRVRELAEARSAGVVIVRWPAAIAPDSVLEWRHREIRWLMKHGVQVRYSWAPLSRSNAGEIK